MIGLFVDGAAVTLVGLNGEFPIPLVAAECFTLKLCVLYFVLHYSPQWTIFTALALIGSGAALADVPTYSDLLQQAQ